MTQLHERVRNTVFAVCLSALFVLGGVQTADAQVTVTLPNTSQTTTVNAIINEQCAVITLPASISFTVSDVTGNTLSPTQTVTISRIVTGVNGATFRGFQIWLSANSATFTSATGASVTYQAGDVTWNAASWSNGTGSAGTLSTGAGGLVATINPGSNTTTTSDLQFTLAARSVDRAGTYTLNVTWKFLSTP